MQHTLVTGGAGPLGRLVVGKHGSSNTRVQARSGHVKLGDIREASQHDPAWAGSNRRFFITLEELPRFNCILPSKNTCGSSVKTPEDLEESNHASTNKSKPGDDRS
jgi:hypothetical protein